MQKVLSILIVILFLGNIYFFYSYNKMKNNWNSSQEQVRLIPHFMTMEQVENMRLYYLKPKIFKAKLYAEAGAFFIYIKKANNTIHKNISCVSWSLDSKEIFYSLFGKNRDLYKLDNNYRQIIEGIDFYDSLCKKRKKTRSKLRLYGMTPKN